jgi:predicted CopG family antitoxin
MAYKFKRFSVCVDDDTYEKLINITKVTGDSLAEVSRELIKKGLAKDYVEDSKSIIASLVREQLQIVLKPNIERLAKIESKTAHMAATATFLNVQALMDLVPVDKRKDVKKMYENARKKAVTYVKQKAEDFDYEKK